LSTLNVEGLHFDPKSDRLFLASKEAGFGDPPTKRTIYEMDENGGAKPHLSIDITGLARKFNERYPTLEAGNISFDPSAVAVHPTPDFLYVTSAAARLVAIFNSDLTDIFPLLAEIFYKPEGLAFFADGTMLTSSEGDKTGFNIPLILLFRYKR